MLPVTRSNESKILDSILKEAKVDKKAVNFPTQEAYDKYMKDHPNADKSLHKVVETKTETKPSVITEPKKEEIKKKFKKKKKNLNNQMMKKK